MLTQAGADWFANEVQLHTIHDLARLWSVSEVKADLIQIGIDGPTQAQVRLLWGIRKGPLTWPAIWESTPREACLPNWERDMKAAIAAAHPGRNAGFKEKVWRRLDLRIGATLSGMRERSARAGVPCDVTANQLRQLFLDSYGKMCPYLGTPLRIAATAAQGIAVDHIIPLAAGGASTIKNLQIISARANRMKDDMGDGDFRDLLDVCAGMYDRSRRSVFRRLAMGSSSVFEQRKIAQDQIRREG